jgi:beta-glucosidase
MIKAIYHFPRGFLWGTATSSYQVEGYNHGSDWWAWEHESGRILQNQRSGKACEWWSGRWREDFDRAAETGQNAHRLSLEWSRIEPNPALWNDDAIAYYREIIQGALERGLDPMVTLHHFSTPQWIQDKGGWRNPEIVHHFRRYTRKVVKQLGDLVNLWVTINEPNTYLYFGYLQGDWPPGDHSLRRLPEVITNLVNAHVAAYETIHNVAPESRVGLAHHFRGFRPMNPGNPLDRWAARMKHRAFNDLFPRVFHTGRVQFSSFRLQLPQAARKQDFFGLNYYTTELCSFNPLKPGKVFEAGVYAKDADLSPLGFIANEPAGFWNALRWALRYNTPVYITENGTEDSGDDFRRRYLALHLHELWRAVNYSWPIRGYFHWTLIDNFEWERGWSQKFGLWGMDVETQKRSKRKSADFYAEICSLNGLSSETVASYAPDVLDLLFPPREPAELTEDG